MSSKGCCKYRLIEAKATEPEEDRCKSVKWILGTWSHKRDEKVQDLVRLDRSRDHDIMKGKPPARLPLTHRKELWQSCEVGIRGSGSDRPFPTKPKEEKSGRASWRR